MRSVQSLRSARGEGIPTLVHRKSDRPVVAVTANIHGDEATGVGVVQALDAWLPEHQHRGTVLLYPTLNPGGLSSRTRVTPEGDDLNRLFPGRPRGSVSERNAAAIWRDLERRKVELLVDLHADSARSIPYAIVDRALRRYRGAELFPVIEKHAIATGLTVLREYPEEQYQRYALDRSLAGAMVNQGAVPSITIEAGPRRWVCREAVQDALDAVRSVLASQDLVAFEPVVHASRVQGGPWRREATPRVHKAGVFHELLDPGDTFDEGQVIGVVKSLTGEVLERVCAPARGLVISWGELSWVQTGAVVGTLGVVEE